MVSFGNASGPLPAIAPLELARRGSLFLTRPSLFDYIARREELETAARALFALVKSGKLRVPSASAMHCRMRRRRIGIWKRAARSVPRC